MTDTRRNGQHSTGWDRLAVAVGEIFSPPLLAAVVIAIVGWTSARPHWHGLLWGLIVLIFVCGLPYAVIIQGVRRGTYTDHHLQLRQQRPIPFAIAAAIALAGLVVSTVGGAPRPLIALVVASVAGLAVTAGASTVWKMSVHSGVTAGSAVVAGMVLGPVGYPCGLVLLAFVGWSRVRLRAHTPAQVAVGAIVGATIAGTCFTLLR